MTRFRHFVTTFQTNSTRSSGDTIAKSGHSYLGEADLSRDQHGRIVVLTVFVVLTLVGEDVVEADVETEDEGVLDRLLLII